MRISSKQIQNKINLINKYTTNEVTGWFTQGCGVYITINGTDYSHKHKDGSLYGLGMKEAAELLKEMEMEAVENFHNQWM